MELDKKDLDPMKFLIHSRYEIIEKYMVLNTNLISICQEMHKLYHEDYDFIDSIYSGQNCQKNFKKQYFKQLIQKKLEIEKEMYEISVKLGIFYKLVPKKGWIYTDGKEEL